MILRVVLFAVGLLWASAASAQPAHVRVVWLEDPAREALISWTTKTKTPGKVGWGVEPQASFIDYTRQATSAATRPDDDEKFWVHHAKLSSLEPGRVVHFRVSAEGSVSKEFWFRAAPDDATPFALLAGGDSRSDSKMRRVMNRRMRTLVSDNEAILALAHGGDFIATGNSWSQWRRWLDDWGETVGEDGRVLPIIPTRGNHEGNGELYNIVFGFPGDKDAGGDWWVTRIGQDFALVTLDSNASQSGSQRKWLASTLKLLQDTRWIAVQYHRPAYPAVKSPGGALYHWVPIFEQYNVDFVLESDGHVLKRTVPIRQDQPSPTGVVYLGEGGLGVPQRTPDLDRWYLQPPGMAMSAHHVQVIHVRRDNISYRAIGAEGEVLDRYEFAPRRLGKAGGEGATIRALPVGPPPPPPDPPIFSCATSNAMPMPTWVLLLAFAGWLARRRRAWVLVLPLVQTGCGADLCQQAIVASDIRVHAVGDSVLWWNSAYCGSIPDLVGVQLGGALVRNSAVAGARLTTNEKPIPEQARDGDWDWVIVNGGGNDLNGCGCDERCDAEQRTLAAPDGSVGAMASLVDRFTEMGARVILLGYYNVGPDALYGFADCNEAFDEMDSRYEQVAELRPDVYFVDAGDVMKPMDHNLYELDAAHPSGPGSATIAAQIVDVIANAD